MLLNEGKHIRILS